MTSKPIHLSMQNGRHKVVLCDPTRLCTDTVPWRFTDEARFVTCPSCLAALADPDAELKADTQDRMNRKGWAFRDD